LSTSFRKDSTCNWHSTGNKLNGKKSSTVFLLLFRETRDLFRGDILVVDED
jgi:hypothetical protein